MKNRFLDWTLAAALAAVMTIFALYEISKLELREARRLNVTLFEQSLKLEAIAHELRHPQTWENRKAVP